MSHRQVITNRITEEEVVEGEGDGVKEEVGGVKVAETGQGAVIGEEEEEMTAGEEEMTVGEEEMTAGEEEMTVGEEEMMAGEEEMMAGEEEEEEVTVGEEEEEEEEVEEEEETGPEDLGSAMTTGKVEVAGRVRPPQKAAAI